MDKAEILALRMGRMTKVGILALVDKGGITVPQAFEMLYQQGREDAIREMVNKINEMPTVQDGDVIYLMPIEMIAEMVKEQKDEKR